MGRAITGLAVLFMGILLAVVAVRDTGASTLQAAGLKK